MRSPAFSVTVTLIEDVTIFRSICSVTGTVDRTSTSCVYKSNPEAVTTKWYGVNATFLKLNTPSVPVITSRRNPLTECDISTFAFGTALPDGSFTTPTTAPDWARATAAVNKNPIAKNTGVSLCKLFIFSSVPLRDLSYVCG